MKRSIHLTVMDPAGNVTIFVWDRFHRTEYAAVAKQLLAREDLRGEQVAFILDITGQSGMPPTMEMCGLEFCGNASRSFALLSAQARGLHGEQSVTVSVSGAEAPLEVLVDPDTNATRIRMPLPLRILDDVIDDQPVRIVDFGGILHILTSGVAATAATYQKFRDHALKKYAPPAVGVMFWDSQAAALTPVVYVRDVDSTYWEGSCASGSTATAICLALAAGDGEHHYRLRQPAGVIETTCIVRDGQVQEVYLEGPVATTADLMVEIEL